MVGDFKYFGATGAENLFVFIISILLISFMPTTGMFREQPIALAVETQILTLVYGPGPGQTKTPESANLLM